MSADPRDRFFDTTHLQDEVEREAVRGGRIVAIAQVPRALLSVIATMALARLLTPNDFGLIGMVTAVTGFLGLFKDMGLSTVTVQRDTITHHEVSGLFWINAGLGAALVVVMSALAPLLAMFYGEPQLTWICIALSVSMLLGGVANQHIALLKRQMRFGALKIVELTALAIGIATAVGAAMSGMSYWALVMQTLVSGVVTMLGAWLATGWKPSSPRRFSGLSELVKFGANLTGFTFVNYFARNLDDVLVGRFAGDTPAVRAHNLGGYQKAYELLMLPLRQLSSPISAVALPTLSRLQGQPERYRATYLRALRLLIVVTMPLVAYLIVMARELITVALGTQWLHAAELFQVLGLAAFTQPLANSSGWLFISQDRTGDMLKWGLFGAGTAVVAFVAGLPWGALGVAAAYAGSSVVIRTPALLWYIGRKGPVKTGDFYAAAAPFLVSGMATAGALVGARMAVPIDAPLVALIAYAPVGIVSAALALMPFPSGRATLRDAWLVLTRRFKGRSVKETAREALAAEAEAAGADDVDGADGADGVDRRDGADT